MTSFPAELSDGATRVHGVEGRADVGSGLVESKELKFTASQKNVAGAAQAAEKGLLRSGEGNSCRPSRGEKGRAYKMHIDIIEVAAKVTAAECELEAADGAAFACEVNVKTLEINRLRRELRRYQKNSGCRARAR